MPDIINDTKKVKARKDHYCDYCGLIIKKGEIYETTILKDDHIYDWKNHIKCSELVGKLKIEHYGEGVTAALFNEYVTEAYRELTGNYDKLPGFKERLETVMRKYIKQ